MGEAFRQRPTFWLGRERQELTYETSQPEFSRSRKEALGTEQNRPQRSGAHGLLSGTLSGTLVGSKQLAAQAGN